MLDVTHKIFVDESCHLERDHKPVMCVGQIKVPIEKYQKYKDEIKAIKLKHKSPFELKWNTASKSRIPLYKELIDYFFSRELSFRAVLIKYKDNLDNAQFNQGSHDNFYYKMIYFLLYNPYNNYDNLKLAVYLDIKDTRGRDKLKKLKEVFNNKFLGDSPFIHFQHISSDESVFLQLVDLFIGAIEFKAQSLHKLENANVAKIAILNFIEEKSGYSLDEGTEPWETKFNIFDHQPRRTK